MNITVKKDGDQWCALAGDNLHEGIAGFSWSLTEALRELADELDEAEARKSPEAQLCDDELDKLLAEYRALSIPVSRRTKIKRLVKPLFEGTPLTRTPAHIITTTFIDRPAYPVPASQYYNWTVKPR